MVYIMNVKLTRFELNAYHVNKKDGKCIPCTIEATDYENALRMLDYMDIDGLKIVKVGDTYEKSVMCEDPDEYMWLQARAKANYIKDEYYVIGDVR